MSTFPGHGTRTVSLGGLFRLFAGRPHRLLVSVLGRGAVPALELRRILDLRLHIQPQFPGRGNVYEKVPFRRCGMRQSLLCNSLRLTSRGLNVSLDTALLHIDLHGRVSHHRVGGGD